MMDYDLDNWYVLWAVDILKEIYYCSEFIKNEIIHTWDETNRKHIRKETFPNFSTDLGDCKKFLVEYKGLHVFFY